MWEKKQDALREGLLTWKKKTRKHLLNILATHANNPSNEEEKWVDYLQVRALSNSSFKNRLFISFLEEEKSLHNHRLKIASQTIKKSR